jgi:hypothetical protein
MSPARSDDPLRRVTLNLYEADCIVLERIYGHGWTTHIRDLVKQRVNQTHSVSRARTLGDLEHGEYAHNDPYWNADTDGDDDDD